MGTIFLKSTWNNFSMQYQDNKQKKEKKKRNKSFPETNLNNPFLAQKFIYPINTAEV